jgi:hypothetical protein
VGLTADADGGVYIFDKNGKVFYTNSNEQTDVFPGRVTSIAVGADRSLYATSTEPTEGGYKIYKWNGSVNRWENLDGGAVQITVDGAGNPYILDDEDRIH